LRIPAFVANSKTSKLQKGRIANTLLFLGFWDVVHPSIQVQQGKAIVLTEYLLLNKKYFQEA
jgi:hypothetical protein